MPPSSLSSPTCTLLVHGFTTADDRRRLEAVVRRGIRSELCVPDHKTVADIVTEADDKLFSLILRQIPRCTQFTT